jgi:uncharacterized membrane protein
MFRETRTEALKAKAAGGKGVAVALAQDKKFRRQLLSAIRHGEFARRRAVRRAGLVAVVSRLAADQKLAHELRQMAENLQRAVTRAEQKRSHTLRNTLILVGAGGAVAVAVPKTRKWLSTRLGLGSGSNPRVVTESIEVGVPVSTAYNQWTQFEDFPLFMEGIDHVQQLDDSRLHWVATVGRWKAEWNAKILEQHPDREISWISEDGKKTRGTVTFEERGPSRTLIRLSMSYKAEGPIEAVGSTAGLDERRVRGDLERFKEFIESRGGEADAWRGEISAGRTQT